MGRSPNESISEHIEQIKHKLNPAGGGYSVGTAAEMLVEVERKGCGFLTANMRELARAGAVVKIKDHNMTSVGKAPRGKTRELAEAIEAITDGQSDFAEWADDFGWMDNETSLDETLDAIRKAYRDLTLPEAVQVEQLKRKKASETEASANRVRKVIDDHPEWALHPEMTMGEIVGITP
jgi:hypothetical protein